MDHSHYLHVQVHVSSESARDTLGAKWNANGFRWPGKTILVAIQSSLNNKPPPPPPPVRGALLHTERGAPQIRHKGRMTN